MNIYTMGDEEWWIGESAAQCFLDMLSVYGYETDLELEDVIKLSEEEIEALKYYREDGSVVSFKEQYEVEILEGEFPRMFAATCF